MKKWMKYSIAIVITLFCCFFYAHVDKAHNIYGNEPDNSNFIAVQMDKNKGIVQAFNCGEEYFNGIELKIALFNEPLKGKMNYSLEDGKGKKLTSGSIEVADIKSGRIRKIKFDRKIKCNKDTTYVIKFSSDGLEEDKAIGLYYAPQEGQKNELNINGEDTEGILVMRTLTHRFDLETFIVVLGFIAYIAAFFKILYKMFS